MVGLPGEEFSWCAASAWDRAQLLFDRESHVVCRRRCREDRYDKVGPCRFARRDGFGVGREEPSHGQELVGEFLWSNGVVGADETAQLKIVRGGDDTGEPDGREWWDARQHLPEVGGEGFLVA